MTHWDIVKRVLNEGKMTRIQVTTGKSEEKSLRAALAKFSKKYGEVAMSVVTKGDGDYGMVYGISVDKQHEKGIQVIIAMALKKHKMSIDSKSMYGK